uniref:Uncharacterized protein n=1 Tax=Tetranychus urticae TaxID=32264 RepID=T1L0L4_TETUR
MPETQVSISLPSEPVIRWAIVKAVQLVLRV